jgi:hypothetical protein
MLAGRLGAGRALAVTVATVALIAVVLWQLPTFLAARGFSVVRDDLSRLTGFSGYVVNAIAALAAALLVLLYRWRVLRRLGAIASLASLFVLYALYQLGLFSISRDTNFTPDGEKIRCYAVTQRGVIYSDRPGCEGQLESVSGVKFALVTPDLVDGLRQLEQNAQGKAFKPVDPDTRDWFHPLTKQPLLYYARFADGSLEFFDAPGFHPGTSQALLPVTPELRAAYEARKEAVRRAEQERLEAEQAALRAAEEQKKAQEEALARAAREKAAAAARARERAAREEAARDADPSSRRAPASGEIYSY